jgi:membrane protein DedA with SNARE-associated domain
VTINYRVPAPTLFVARFTFLTSLYISRQGAFVPLLAGILRMSSEHFYFANVLSALVWAPLHVFPGIFVGMAIALGGVHAQQLGVLALGALMIGVIAWSLLKARRRPAPPAATEIASEAAAGRPPPGRVRRANG